MENKKRVLSGMRPTGLLHIGHYFGALENWIKLQNDSRCECFFCVVDWHALTSNYADTSQIAEDTIGIATDWLASGLDPAKCTMFIQSSVPEHAELHLLLSMVTPLSWLERVPTYKEALANITDKDLHMYGFLGYPVLQTADIVMYGEPGRDLQVPVGEDQVSHVELSREIVHRFNTFYGLEILDAASLWRGKKGAQLVSAVGYSPRETPAGEPDADQLSVFRRDLRALALETGISNFLSKTASAGLGEHFRFVPRLSPPQALLTPTPRIPGTDGRKMSKSYGNSIMLSEPDEDIRKKTKLMMTDPARKRRTDPGDPDVCPVYDWHKLFSPPETLKWSAEGCRSARIGCIECKTAMADNLIKWIEPVRARRQEYAAHPDRVLRILDDGSAKAREVARKTMDSVREAVFNWKQKREEIAEQSSAQNVKVGE